MEADAIKTGMNPHWEITHRLPVKVRLVRMHEIPRVASIERQCFPDDPWTELEIRKFRRCLNTCAFVAVAGAKVVGFILINNRDRSVNLMSIAVDPAYRRKGVGRQLVDKATELLDRRRKSLVTHVRENNLQGQLFFRQVGFRVTRIMREVYRSGNPELCIRMSIRKVSYEDDQSEGEPGLVS